MVLLDTSLMPTRYLKPGICDSDAIEKCSPMAEILFYRLLVNVDDYGRLDARSAVIKARCFPLKDSIKSDDIELLLIELSRANLIQVYATVNGCKYLQFMKWDNVPRSKESKFPIFCDSCIQLYADVNNPHTNLPVTVTVTVTETETVNRKQKQETTDAAFALPDWIDKDHWDLWVKSRKKMTNEQKTMQVEKLKKWKDEGLDYKSALFNAAANGTQGLFLPNFKPQAKTPSLDNFASKDYGSGVTLL